METTLEKKWPHLYRELMEVKTKLENHFKDVCDLEFTIENERLYIIGVKVAKRSRKANLKFALDFFLEGEIDLNEALSRIRPLDVHEIVKPHITNINELQLIGKGLPASFGVATGKIAFSSDDAENRKKKGENVVLVLEEVSPEDVGGILASNGIITTRGGMTSHAALTSRGIGKSCVVGLGTFAIDSVKRILISDGKELGENDCITLNGYTGVVYSGKASFKQSNWQNSPELIAVSKMIELAIRCNEISKSNIGHCWLIRDFFVHLMPIKDNRSSKNYHSSKINRYISFNHPSRRLLNSYWKMLYYLKAEERENYTYILKGLYRTLSRVLSNDVGIGNHFKFFRPLFDPMQCINKKGENTRIQLIGIEFFSINRYISYFIDIYKIKLFLEIEVLSDHDLWFLDHTNSRGESIIDNGDNFSAYRILVNDAVVAHEDLPNFYNLLRKREYYWNWFKYNRTSYKEIISFLKWNKKKRSSNFRLNTLSHELGLLGNNYDLATLGKSLIGSTSEE